MSEIVAFARVSTRRQAQHGESLPEQFARIESWAAQNGHTIIGRFEDAGLSGRSMAKRAGIREAVSLTCRRRDRILAVTSLSRVARNGRDCLDIGDALRRAGSGLVSLTEALNSMDANGRLIWALLAAIHAWTAQVGAENTAHVLRAMDARGLRTSGKIKFGYCLNADGRTLSPDPDEQAVIARITALRDGDGLSWAKIAQRLDEAGIRTREGKRSWLPKVIAGIYQREGHARRAQITAA